MLIRNFMQTLTCILVSLLILSGWSFAVFSKIDPNVLTAAQKSETVKVIIWLQEQPGHEIAQAIQDQYRPRLDAVSREIRDKVRPFLKQKRPLPLNVKQQVKALREELDNLTRQMRREIRAQVWNRISAGQRRVQEAIEKAGGVIHARIVILNSIGAQLPSDVVNQIALLPDVQAGAHITKDKAAYWDGKNDEGSFVASGVYFYTLEVNGKEIGTRKMIMSK